MSTDPATLAQDKAATVAAIQRLKAADIDTYVIGYDTATDAALAANLDEFAAAGGTGAHRPVEDEASLISELESIAGQALSCSFQLDNPPGDPSYVRVLLDTQQIDLNDVNGWELVGDRTVKLVGGACDRLRSEGSHDVKVTVECEPVAIL